MKFYNLGDKTFKTDFNNPGRPIISGCDSPSPNYILGALLKTNCPNIPSYIKDTNDFLQTILHSDLNIPPNSIPSTAIPQDEGTDICLSGITNFMRTVSHYMFNFILKCNFFQI